MDEGADQRRDSANRGILGHNSRFAAFTLLTTQLDARSPQAKPALELIGAFTSLESFELIRFSLEGIHAPAALFFVAPSRKMHSLRLLPGENEIQKYLLLVVKRPEKALK